MASSTFENQSLYGSYNKWTATKPYKQIDPNEIKIKKIEHFLSPKSTNFCSFLPMYVYARLHHPMTNSIDADTCSHAERRESPSNLSPIQSSERATMPCSRPSSNIAVTVLRAFDRFTPYVDHTRRPQLIPTARRQPCDLAHRRVATSERHLVRRGRGAHVQSKRVSTPTYRAVRRLCGRRSGLYGPKTMPLRHRGRFDPTGTIGATDSNGIDARRRQPYAADSPRWRAGRLVGSPGLYTSNSKSIARPDETRSRTLTNRRHIARPVYCLFGSRTRCKRKGGGMSRWRWRRRAISGTGGFRIVGKANLIPRVTYHRRRKPPLAAATQCNDTPTKNRYTFRLLPRAMLRPRAKYGRPRYDVTADVAWYPAGQDDVTDCWSKTR